MTESTSTDVKPFYVGLCMAGAVSAGAYTAGVMDYLFEALSEWERRRGEPGVPEHRVQIPVMGGASAGGMTSIMGAAALYNSLNPLDKPETDLLAEHPENKLYHSWVDLYGPDTFSQMLDTSDIGTNEVDSLLNSDFIVPIAQRVVTVTAPTVPLPKFIMPGMKLFTTLTNLQGFDYVADFDAANPQTSKYTMVIHNDYACFQLTDKPIEGANDGWIPLNLTDGTNKDVAANAAMATGAFPIGLKSRLMDRDPAYVNNNPWLKAYLAGNPITATPYNTLNIDGGVINNEPFDKVRDVLVSITGEQSAENQDYTKFKSTILMIEPFPTKASAPINKSQKILNVLGLMVPSIISQMRSKPINFKEALNSSCAGQYLISPTRNKFGPNDTNSLVGEQAIACGALGGFSGFINKEFRVHDFFLGRYNCKIFLRDYFTISESALAENEIFRDGYANINKNNFKAKDGSYQIIPVFDNVDYTFPDFSFSSGTNWPALQNDAIDNYSGALKKRVKAIVQNLFTVNGAVKALLSTIGFLGLNNAITNGILKVIKEQLALWELLPKQEE